MTSSINHIKRRLAERAGLDPDLLDRAWFERVVGQRVRDLNLDNCRAYCELLDRDARELQRLVEQISVTETWFFRYPQSFHLLLRHLKALRSPDNTLTQLKMLSAACATGQEPYSMAIAAAQAGWPLASVVVDAVDRNEDAISAADGASYPRRALRDDAPDWASHWLHADGERLRVDARIKAAVNWIVGDILHLPAQTLQEGYDVVFCRNLLIYLHQSARARLVDRLSAWLSPGGLLFVGHAERIESLRSRFQFVADPHTFALRARDPKQPSATRPESPEDLTTTRPSETPVAAREATRKRDTATQAGPPAPARTSVQRRQAVALGHGRRAESPHGDRSSPAESQLRPEGLPTLREASALADNGDLDEALRVVKAVIETQTPDAETFGLLGSVHLAKGNLPLARKALVKSLYLDNRREETLLQLALVYQRMGNQAQAARYRRRAAQAHHAGRSERQR